MDRNRNPSRTTNTNSPAINKAMQAPIFCNIIEQQMHDDIARQNQAKRTSSTDPKHYEAQQNFINSIRKHNKPFNTVIEGQRNNTPVKTEKYSDPKLMHTSSYKAHNTRNMHHTPELSKQMQDILSTAKPLSNKDNRGTRGSPNHSEGSLESHGFSDNMNKLLNTSRTVSLQQLAEITNVNSPSNMKITCTFVTKEETTSGSTSKAESTAQGIRDSLKDGNKESYLAGNDLIQKFKEEQQTNSSHTNTAKTHPIIIEDDDSFETYKHTDSSSKGKDTKRAFAQAKRHVNDKFKRQSYPIKHESVFKQERRASLGSVPPNTGKPMLKRRHYSEATPSLYEGAYQKRFRRGSGPPQLQGTWFDDAQHSPTRYLETPFTLETLSHEIQEESQRNLQTAAILEKKMNLRLALEGVFRRSFHGCTLHLVGSSTNGLGNANSDADFCLMLTQWREIDQRSEARRILLQLNHILQSCRFVNDSHVIFATVPIVKFVDAVSKCECDININNHVGIRNTHLLRAYCAVDNRVKPLILIVKKWAKKHGINDPKGGTLSSYALSLMVIIYLQCGCVPPVLPSLHRKCPDLLADNRDVTKLLEEDTARIINQRSFLRSNNTKTVGELLVGFFQFYADVVEWETDYLSVRQGARCLRDFKWRNKYMCIEEPFDSNNVAKTVHSDALFNKIKMKMNLAAHTLKVSPSLQSIL